jgi:hypothetical protein
MQELLPSYSCQEAVRNVGFSLFQDFAASQLCLRVVCRYGQRLHQAKSNYVIIEVTQTGCIHSGVWEMMRWLLIELSVVLTAVIAWQIYSALRPPLLCERGPDPHIQRGFESVSLALSTAVQDWSLVVQPYTKHIQSQVCCMHSLSCCAQLSDRETQTSRADVIPSRNRLNLWQVRWHREMSMQL